MLYSPVEQGIHDGTAMLGCIRSVALPNSCDVAVMSYYCSVLLLLYTAAYKSRRRQSKLQHVCCTRCVLLLLCCCYYILLNIDRGGGSRNCTIYAHATRVADRAWLNARLQALPYPPACGVKEMPTHVPAAKTGKASGGNKSERTRRQLDCSTSSPSSSSPRHPTVP